MRSDTQIDKRIGSHKVSSEASPRIKRGATRRIEDVVFKQPRNETIAAKRRPRPQRIKNFENPNKRT